MFEALLILGTIAVAAGCLMWTTANPTTNGVPVNFGFQGASAADGSQGITITGVSGVLLQSVELSKGAEVERARDGNGNTVVKAWSDIHDEATLEWIVAGSSLSTALTNTALSAPGALVVITACTSVPSLVATTWEVQAGGKISASNTSFKKISLPIHKYPGITAAAS